MLHVGGIRCAPIGNKSPHDRLIRVTTIFIMRSMQSYVNPHQLVLRLDSATGFAKVGWAADLPIGRFVHVDLIAETPQCGPISPNNPLFEDFNKACHRAQQINQPLISSQKSRLLAEGCLPVPLNLNDPHAATGADRFGSFQESATGAMFRLTANFASVWAVIDHQAIIQLRSRRPPRKMEELEFQVWTHYVLNQLRQFPGKITTGTLFVQESGLWFRPAT